MPTTESILPRLTKGCDLRSLPIGPVEAFLLSCVDGCTNVEDISHTTGMPVDSVLEHLRRLAALGAVDWSDARALAVQFRDDPANQTPDARPSAPRLAPGGEVASPGGPEAGAPATSTAADVGNARHPSEPPLDRIVKSFLPPSELPLVEGPPVKNPPAEPRAASPQRIVDPASNRPQTSSLTSPLGRRGPAAAEPVRQEAGPMRQEAEVQLTPEFQGRVLQWFARLESTDHYALLEVARDASKNEIKDAYFARVQEFHGDRFFNKRLGSFKPKIDRIFTALTRASDTLSRRKTREEYDLYLASVEETLGVSSIPARLRAAAGISESRPAGEQRATPEAASPIEEDVGPAPEDEPFDANPGRLEATGVVLRAPKLPSSFGVAQSKVRIQEAPMGPLVSFGNASERRTATPDARRQLAARKLRGTLLGDLRKGASGGRPAGTTPSMDPEARRAMGDELKARLVAGGGAAPADPAQPANDLTSRYLAIAAEAEAAEEWASAANALRTVAEMLADDADIQRRLDRATLEVDRRFAVRFREQASYEERAGEYEKAARTFERAARGKNSGELYQRAASCMLRAGNHNRKAVELGRQAIILAPENVSAHLTLSRAFFAAGMFASAVAEVARALELEPTNEMAKKLHKDFKKSL